MWIQCSLMCDVCGQEFSRIESMFWTCDDPGDRRAVVCAVCENLVVSYVLMSLRWLATRPDLKRARVDLDAIPPRSSWGSPFPEAMTIWT